MAIKKRKDAHLCYDVPIYNHIWPYLLQSRCDSLVFYDTEFDVTNTMRFVREWNKSHPNLKTRLSTVLLAAIIRTIALRPKVNRFIANKTFWERDDLSLSFVVKKDLTEDSPETSTPLYFDRLGTFEETISIIEKYVEDTKNQEPTAEINKTDYTIATLFKFLPKWLIQAVVNYYGRKDRKGKGCPKWVRDADGLHVSIFVANIGSLGMKNAHHHHHLYEWGTTSLFCVIEDVSKRIQKDDDGKVVSSKDIMKCSFTLDERICDGLYFMQTIALLSKILKEPETLLIPLKSSDLPHFVTREEYQTNMKMTKLALKEARKKEKLAKKEAKKLSK